MKRNDGLDFLKFICAFLVICIHISFPGTFGIIIKTVARISVPVFFMITGYFYESTKRKNGELVQIKKLLYYFIGANALYLFWSLLLNLKELPVFFDTIVNMQTFIKFVFLNDSPFGGHLWYLSAVLYVLLIIFLFEKRWDRQKLYPLIPILLMADLVFGKYSLLIFGREFPVILVRNFLFVGLPYFLIGDMLFRYQTKIRSRKLFFILIFTMVNLFEYYALERFAVNATRDHYISTTILAICVFLLWNNPKWHTVSNRLFRRCCFIGEKLTVYIYILHPIFIGVLLKVSTIIKSNNFIRSMFSYVYPFVVFVVSILASWILYSRKSKTEMRVKESNPFISSHNY